MDGVTDSSTPAPWDSLALRQLAAIEAFHRARHLAEQASRAAAASREARLDTARRLEVMRRQHAAVLARTDATLASGRERLARTPRPRALVAHRGDWFGRTVSAALTDQGFDLLGHLDNGADAVGAALAEQPDLLLLQDPLPMMTGEQVVREVHAYSPATVVAVHTERPQDEGALLLAGAGDVFARRVPPAEVARLLGAKLGAAPEVPDSA